MTWWEWTLFAIGMLTLPAVMVWWMSRGATATRPSDYELARAKLSAAFGEMTEEFGKAFTPWAVAMNAWLLKHAPWLAPEPAKRRWWHRFRR